MGDYADDLIEQGIQEQADQDYTDWEDDPETEQYQDDIDDF